MVMIADIASGRLGELVKQVQAGNEVLLTYGDKPVAMLIAPFIPAGSTAPLKIHSLSGHRVLTPAISQDELADELFRRQ